MAVSPTNNEVAVISLNAIGHVAPLGRVTLTGTTSSLGSAAGRFPLILRLRTAAGAVTIRAHGPMLPAFSSP